MPSIKHIQRLLKFNALNLGKLLNLLAKMLPNYNYNYNYTTNYRSHAIYSRECHCISGAPRIKDTNQFPNAPIGICITIKKFIKKLWAVTSGHVLTVLYFSYFVLNPIVIKIWENLIK